MWAREKSCCFTGHRPEKLPWGFDETDSRCLALKRRIAGAVEAAIPCPTQARAWTEDQRARYARLVEACDLETMVSARYTSGCMLRRDRYMVDHAALLIAAFNGTPGGTRYTVEYAMRQGVTVVDLPVE